MAQVRKRRLNIGNAFVLVEAAHQLESPLPFGVRLVCELDAGFEAPEQIRDDGKVTARSKVVGDRAHHGVDAEDLLDHHNARSTLGSGIGEIGAEFAVGTFDANVLAHRYSGRQVSGIRYYTRRRVSGIRYEKVRWPLYRVPGPCSLITGFAARAAVRGAAAPGLVSPGS